MPASLSPRVVVSGAWGAGMVLTYFAPCFFSPYLIEGWKTPLTYSSISVIAAVGAVLAAAVAVAWPRCQPALVRILAATAFVYLTWRLAIPWIEWLSRLPLTSAQHYWVSAGPGEGTLGDLPAAVAVLLGGRLLFGMSVREQWNGRLRFSLRDLWYGGSVGVGLSAFALTCVALAGAGHLVWEPNWAGHGVNAFSNLYEEVLARGLLLQVVRREGGRWFAMIWTGLVFGTMHFNYTMNGLWFALGVATITWIFAWVVLQARSLWAGWVVHQVLDMIVDSLLH